ncbi:MAG: Ig-like domain-containing protein, partial [Promethearchaeota archaeon]
ESEDLTGSKKFDISQYSNEDIMIMFTLRSNNYVPPPPDVGYGWLLSNIYVGYDKSTDFIAPQIKILNPEPDITVNSIIMIKANITDDIELDESRIYILLNNKSVDIHKLTFNSTTNILEFNWNTAQYNDGRYEIRVVAYDEEGNKAESFITVIVNNVRWWQTWGLYIIIIIIVVIAGIAIYFISEKKRRIWIDKIRTTRIEKIKIKDFDRDQVIQQIELIEHEEELKRPLTLYCKFCGSWFFSSKFDIICPVCEHDQIYATYICTNCGKIHLKDEPRENYYCKNKVCEGVRLIRREKEDIQELLAKEGKVLREFKTKKKKFSILDI